MKKRFADCFKNDMPMEPTLKEKFIILAYHPDKGTNLATNYIGYGLAGAILLELAAAKKLRMDGKKVVLTDTHPTGDPVLDQALAILKTRSKPMKIKSLIGKINFRAGRYKKPVLEKLLKNSYLLEERKRFLIFPYKRYPSGKKTYRKQLVEEIRRKVLRDDSSDEDIPLLIGLAGACRFWRRFFKNAEERKKAKKRIKVIIKESQVDTAIDETIKAVQAAIVASVAASAVVTSAAGSS